MSCDGAIQPHTRNERLAVKFAGFHNQSPLLTMVIQGFDNSFALCFEIVFIGACLFINFLNLL